jgi:peptide/nickel transport system substrate-binding protein
LAAWGSALALILTACGGGSDGAPGNHQLSGPVFTYVTYAKVMDDGWDPATEYSDGIIAMSNVYETLTRYDPVAHRVDPLLATNWSHSPNGLTWTFQLRHGVYFHTGRPMIAEAARAAIMRTKKLDAGASYIWGAVRSISTPGLYTLVFHLSHASPLALEASADYSAYIYDTQAAGPLSNLTKWLDAPHDAGTGPYELQNWNNGGEFEVILKAFPRYWGGWRGAHYQRVVFRVDPRDATATGLLRSGAVDFVEQLSSPPWKSLAGVPGIRLVSAPSWQNLLGQLNCQALSLPVRQAISYGIDYFGIIAALQGAAIPSSGIVPPGLFGHFTKLPNYTYDPAKAAQLLHSAGYGPGKKPLNLSLTYAQGNSNEQIVANLLKSSLATGTTGEREAQPRPAPVRPHPVDRNPAGAPRPRRAAADHRPTWPQRRPDHPRHGPVRLYGRGERTGPAAAGARSRPGKPGARGRRVLLPVHDRAAPGQHAWHEPLAQAPVLRHRTDHGGRGRVLPAPPRAHSDHGSRIEL